MMLWYSVEGTVNSRITCVGPIDICLHGSLDPNLQCCANTVPTERQKVDPTNKF